MKRRKLFLQISIIPILFILLTLLLQVNIKAVDTNNYYIDTNDGNNITRTYNDFYIANVNENFRAPSGCVLTLGIIEDNLNKVNEDIKNHAYFKDIENIDMVNICVYRVLNGSKMYSESTCDWTINVDNFASYVKGKLPDLKLYEIEEKISDVEISAIIEIELYITTPELGSDVIFKMVFDVETYQVKKYEDGDILNLKTFYYCMNLENRVTVYAEIDENLFSSKYGFKTDGRTKHDWDEEYDENYLIKYIDKKTNVILDTDDAFDSIIGIEIENVPTEPLTIYAVLTFTQNGIEYAFYSNELTLCNPINGLLVDGYNNRDSVGKNNNHSLELDVNLFDEKVIEANISLELENQDCILLNRSYDANFIFDGEEDTDVAKEFDSDFFKFDFKYNEAGEYVIIGTLYYLTDHIQYNGEIELSIKVTEEEKEYTPLDKALSINTNNSIVCVAGGSEIKIETSISSDVLNNEETPTYEWVMSRVNVIELDNYNSSSVTIKPIGGGVVTLTVNCSGKSFDNISETIVLNVIDDIYSISKLNVNDEFHYSNKPLTIYLNVDKYSNIVNFTPEWIVTDKDGKVIEYTNNNDLSITIQNPSSNDYTISATYNGVELDCITVEVRTINLNEFIKTNIIWILLVTIVFVGLVVLFKSLLERKKSLVKKIEKTNKMFETFDKESIPDVKELQKLKLSIMLDIDYAKNLNMNALDEYEKTIRYLNKSLNDVKEIIKNINQLTIEAYDDLYDNLLHDLSKTLNVAKEIEDAKELAYKNSLMANENNIVTVDKNDKEKK